MGATVAIGRRAKGGSGTRPYETKPIKCIDQYAIVAACLFFGGEDALDLLDVIHIVAGEHSDDCFNGFFAALGVDAVVLPLVR